MAEEEEVPVGNWCYCSASTGICRTSRRGDVVDKKDIELRILMLEDVPADAELIERELRKGGIVFTSIRVETREDFRRKLEEFAPDLILADHKLPSFDGLSALTIAKGECPDVPFIFVTGSMGEEWAIDTLKKGATDYILKERLTRLAPAVTRALAEVREREEREKTERDLRRVTRALKTLTECSQVLVRSTEESILLRDICRTIVGTGGYRLAWVGFAARDDAKTVRPMAQAGFEEGYLETINITWADDEGGRGPTGTAVRTGKPVIVKNVLRDPQYERWRIEAAKRGYASSIALPLLEEGRAFGALNIYADEPEAFNDEELKLLVEMADDLAYGIKSLRTAEERKKSEGELRQRVEELERFRKATIQREFRMKELKDRVKELEEKLKEKSPGVDRETGGKDTRRAR